MSRKSLFPVALTLAFLARAALVRAEEHTALVPAAVPAAMPAGTVMQPATAVVNQGTSGVTAIAGPSPSGAPMSAQAVNAAVKGAVYRLSTHLERASSRSLHGTAFAVDAAGLLVTNFHVVRESLIGGSEYRLVLEAPEGPVPATVIAVDVVNDLALVRAGKAFDKVLNIANAVTASEGEIVYSIGFPANEQMTFIQGNYGGEKPMGFIMAGFASMPLNQGMSGGPMLNAQAEVIGVNRAIVTRAQNLSFFSPLAALRELVTKNVEAGRSLASTVTNWKKQAVDSVKRQEELTLNLTREGKRERLGEISFQVPLPNQSCGQSKTGKKDSATEGEIFICQSNSLTPLVGESNALEVITLGMNTDKALMKIAAPVKAALEGMYRKEKQQILSMQKEGRAPASLAGQEEKAREHCGLKNVQNGHGVEMTVSFCSISNTFYDGLFSTFVRVDVKGKSSGITSLVQMYQGLSAEATADVLGKFLDSIQQEGG